MQNSYKYLFLHKYPNNDFQTIFTEERRLFQEANSEHQDTSNHSLPLSKGEITL